MASKRGNFYELDSICLNIWKNLYAVRREKTATIIVIAIDSKYAYDWFFSNMSAIRKTVILKKNSNDKVLLLSSKLE